MTLILLLTACSALNPSTEVTTAIDAGPVNMDYEGALPVSTQLAVGALALDGTEQALDADQAALLAPLWKAVRSLSDNETVAAAKMDALINQISGALSDEQLTAIAELQLTGESMRPLAAELGIVFGPGGPAGEGFNPEDLSPEQQATLQAAREDGEAPPGGRGFGDAGGGLPGLGGRGGRGDNGDVSPEARQTAIAERGGRFGSNGLSLPPQILDTLIDYLENIEA